MMRPVSPVFPKAKLPEIVLAANQEQYIPLPAVRMGNQPDTFVTRWRLSELDRALIADGADIVLQQLTFGRDFQPVNLQVVPEEEDPEIIE